MISRTVVLAVFLCVLTRAQSTPPPAPSAIAQAQTGAGAAVSQRPAPATRHQRMGEMQQQLLQMRALLASMRNDAAAIQDPAGKQLAERNIAMWDMLLNHMQSMMVSEMRSMAPGADRGQQGVASRPAPQEKPSTPTPPRPRQP